MERTYDDVNKFTDEELSEVINELKEMSQLEVPADAKMSQNLLYLVKIEQDKLTWFNQLTDICDAVNFEILKRFKNNKI